MDVKRHNLKSQISLWVPFGVSSLLSLVFGRVYWAWAMIGHSDKPLIALGILSVILAIRIVFKTGFRLWPIISVIVVLTVGQSSLIESIVMIIFWRFRGFAP